MQIDPDILVGYEVQSMSLGYLSERAIAAHNFNLLRKISRVPNVESIQERQDDQYGEYYRNAWGKF